MTPLEASLRELIEANGPITVAQYMAHCLGDPRHGYYLTRDPLGAGGDFTTAPEISQMFGEILGAWLVEAWRSMDRPDPARLVELGAGRGTLMADILRVADRAPEFRRAVSVHLVETSPVLRERQRATLAAHRVAWHASFADVPDGPLFLIANEFFDALPVHQFVRVENGWRERVVGLDAAGALAFGLGPGGSDGLPADLPVGSVLETRPAADAIIADVSKRVIACGGTALIVDYGHAASAAGDTLQAVRGHAWADPLAAPGEADLTAHVDFAALARAARTEGAAVHGPIGQGEFLLALGLLARAGRLGGKADEASREAIRVAVERLAGPEQMGTLFKVLAVTRPDPAPQPFGHGV